MRNLNLYYLAFFYLCSTCVLGVVNFRQYYPKFDLSLIRFGRSLRWFQRYYANVNVEPSPQYLKYKEIFERLYEKDKKLPFSDEGKYQIPRIVHQIWLGGPLPDKYKELAVTWEYWKGWQYKLWTEDDVKELTLYNSDLYQKARNYGEKADILRYEILYKFGGLYVDTDTRCLSPDFFDFAHQAYKFFAGIEPLEFSAFSIGNAILASTPGHPFLEKIVKGLSEQVLLNEEKTGNIHTVQRTGTIYLTKQVCENWEVIVKDGIIFPPTFFYPLIGRTKLYFTQECAAVHYWDSSWLK